MATFYLQRVKDVFLIFFFGNLPRWTVCFVEKPNMHVIR